MIGKFIGIGALIFVCFAGWQIGGMLSTDALGMMLGVLFGMMAGIPAALIALSASNRPQEHVQPTVQHVDVYHHNAEIATAQPSSVPARAIVQVQPPKYRVVDNSAVLVLPTTVHGKLEVKR